jgi:alpha-galactosidase
MQDSILRLESTTVDVVIKTTRSPKLSTGGRIFTFCRMLRFAAVANGRLDRFPGHADGRAGHGLFGSPALKGIARGWTVPGVQNHEVQQEANTDDYREDEHAGLRLTSELALDASGVLVVRHGLTNLKAQPWQVDRFAVTLPVAERARR